MEKPKVKEEEEIVYFGPGLTNEEIDKNFNKLYKHLLDYTEEVFNLVKQLCPNTEDQIRLALNIGETDGNLLLRLVEKECEKRHLKKIKSDIYSSSMLPKKPIAMIEIINEREIDTIRVRDIPEMILETQSDQRLRPMLIHKSRCVLGKIGVVLFSLSGDHAKGFALFLPNQSFRNIGTLHVLDELGLKRKIRSNIRILDLEDFKDADTYNPDSEELSREKSTVEPLIRTK